MGRCFPYLWPRHLGTDVFTVTRYLSCPKGPKYQYSTKYGFCSSNFPDGLGKYSPYGYLGPLGVWVEGPNNLTFRSGLVSGSNKVEDVVLRFSGVCVCVCVSGMSNLNSPEL